MNESRLIRTFFVYGTLKRGECREHAWPVAPESIIKATTLGRLYDLGDYPAMTAGDDVVVGELWAIPSSGLAETLRVLDAIEGYQSGNAGNLYERRVVECRDEDDRVHLVYTYFYLRSLPSSSRLEPKVGESTVCWLASE